MSERTRFSTSIHCPSCGKSGEARWEENSEPSPRGMERTLIGVSDGFHHDPQQQQLSGDPAIVCGGCGTQQPD